MKKIGQNFGLLFLTLLLFYGVGEVSLRFFHPQPIQPESIHEYVYGINNGLRANVSQRWRDRDYDILVTTNSKRLRDREFSYEREEGVIRILALGDSFTFGFGVNLQDSYPKVLEKILNDSAAGGWQKYEVINTGVPGWGNAQQLVFWIEEGRNYNPDIVILCLVENDPQDNVNAGLFGLMDGQLIPKERKKNFITKTREIIRRIPLANYLSQHSHFYNFVRGKVLHAMYSQISYREAPPIISKRHEHEGGVNIPNLQGNPAEVLTISILKNLIAQLQKSQTKLVIFDVPGTLAKFPIIQEFLTERTDHQSIFLLDTKVYLNEQGQDEKTTYLSDGHWNIQGHKLTGRMLANFITSSKLGHSL